MENTETPIQNGEPTTVVEETPIETVPETTTTEEIVENKIEEEVVPPTTSTSTEEKTTEEKPAPTTEEESTPTTEEQENVTDTNSTVPPTSLSPGRINIPLKEVNESEKEEPTPVLTNGTENGLSKKRELEQEDDEKEETTNNTEERNGIDQTKKIKIAETIDTPIIETKETENNLIVNGNTAVEV